MRKKKVSLCHPDRPHFAKGYCYQCYRPLATLSSHKSYLKHKETRKERGRQWAIDNPKRLMLTRTKTRAKRLGIVCTLTVEDFEIPKECPILGLLIKPGRGHIQPDSPSLDRMVPKLGYVRGNVQVVSVKANVMKNNATETELRTFARWIHKTYGA